MGHRVTPNVVWSRLSEFIADSMGLHFPIERWGDLQRGLSEAAGELGFADVAGCADWLLSAPLTNANFQVLASHLTVGETYFFREKKTFEVLTESVFPDLIRDRRGEGKRLSIWSAACSTGEEAYSLAITLHQLIPDLADWHLTILATDINERSLIKASEGVYGEWSFRDAPAWLKERYFRRTPDGHFAISPEIKKLVTFARLNLVENVYSSVATPANSMDMIFCRNVLMYFKFRKARKVVEQLRRFLVKDGWLVVSPSESSQALLSRFVAVNFPGVILYQRSNTTKQGAQPATPFSLGESAATMTPPLEEVTSQVLSLADSKMESTPAMPLEEPAQAEQTPTAYALAQSLFQAGRCEEATDTLLNSFTCDAGADPPSFALLARLLANQGQLAGALTWCERWVDADKLDPSGHYLLAVVLQELGEHEQARCSLQRALYLQPDFVLAHFALANLARSRKESVAAERHFAAALRLLRRCNTSDLLPESDGLTAGRLTEIISSIAASESAP